MVRVWFGNEGDGLRRDREEYVLTILRPCADLDAIKRFYCEGLGFYVTGITSRDGQRMMFLASRKLPSVALGFQLLPASEMPDHHGMVLDVGVWNDAEWEETSARMAGLGFEPAGQKLSNPHQKWLDYADPSGILIRYTYTRPPVTQKRLDPNAPRDDLEG